jgi:hypothetical protein
MVNELSVIEFISFCIESFAQREKMSGADVMQMFIDNDIITYLVDNYDVLHTQGPGYIIPLLSGRMEKK